MEIDKLSHAERLELLRAMNQRGPMVEQLRELLADVPDTKIGQTITVRTPERYADAGSSVTEAPPVYDARKRKRLFPLPE